MGRGGVRKPARQADAGGPRDVAGDQGLRPGASPCCTGTPTLRCTAATATTAGGDGATANALAANAHKAQCSSEC